MDIDLGSGSVAVTAVSLVTGSVTDGFALNTVYWQLIFVLELDSFCCVILIGQMFIVISCRNHVCCNKKAAELR